jgi:hypothetical protein
MEDRQAKGEALDYYMFDRIDPWATVSPTYCLLNTPPDGALAPPYIAKDQP